MKTTGTAVETAVTRFLRGLAPSCTPNSKSSDAEHAVTVGGLGAGQECIYSYLHPMFL